MDTSPVPPQKKGLGVFAWLGIGCGALIVILVIGGVIASVALGPKIKQFTEDASKDPTKATANMMVNVSMGQIEMVKADEVNKRYTIRQKSTGQLTTIYWDAKLGKPLTVSGDFSAIPKEANSSAAPAPQ